MWKKLLILSLSIAVLFVFSAPISSVDAGGKWGNWGKRKINWRIAGTIVQKIPLFNPVDDSDEGLHSLINLSAQGRPGPAKITLLSKPVEPGTGTVGTNFTCDTPGPGWIPIAYFEKNDFVALFPDQSILLASIDKSVNGGGILCIDPTFQTTYFIVGMIIDGGFGRWEGAGGSFIAEGYGYPGFSTGGTLVSENGTIKGMIEFD